MLQGLFRISVLAAMMATAVVAAMTGTSPGTAHAETYENEGFYIEYPDGWDVQDSRWESDRRAAFVSGIDSMDSITVSLHNEYPLAFQRQDAPDMSSVDLDTLDTIASDASKRCRENTDGLCWSFELIDSRITSISHKRAALVDFEARTNATPQPG